MSRDAGPAGRGRPPQAAARRAGLEDVEKVVTSAIDSANKTAEPWSSKGSSPSRWRSGAKVVPWTTPPPTHWLTAESRSAHPHSVYGVAQRVLDQPSAPG
jgi:hypothetical protein